MARLAPCLENQLRLSDILGATWASFPIRKSVNIEKNDEKKGIGKTMWKNDDLQGTNSFCTCQVSPSQFRKPDRLPTTHFSEVQFVSFREGQRFGRLNIC